MSVLELSKDPKVRKLWRDKSQSMLMWYSGFDIFSEALDSEAEYEKDFRSDLEVEADDADETDVTGDGAGRACHDCAVM